MGLYCIKRLNYLEARNIWLRSASGLITLPTSTEHASPTFLTIALSQLSTQDGYYIFFYQAVGLFRVSVVRNNP